MIVHGGFARWDASRLVEGFRRVAGDEVADLARRSFAGEDLPEGDWAHVFAAFGQHLPDDAREQQTPKNLALNAHGMELIRRLDIVHDLGQVDAPTLAVVGERDPVTPVDAAAEIVRALPDGLGKIEVVEAAGHFAWLDAPDRFWPPILDFIQAWSAARTTREGTA